MPKLLAIDKQIRTAGTRLLTDAEGALCCCRGTNQYRTLSDCCDGLPRFAVPQSVIDQVVVRCARLNVEEIIVKVQGSERCYRFDLFALSLEQVEAAGFSIIDDAEDFRCVDRQSTYRPERCYTLECPTCSTDCCLVGLYRKNCPDLVIDANLKANVCCNYGRQATRTDAYDVRTFRETYTSLNVGGADPFCPPGCYSELFNGRVETTESGTQVSRFTRCDERGDPVFSVECLRGEHFRRTFSTRRRWAFADPKPTDTNCLFYEDFNDDQQNTIDGCIGVTSGSVILAPPPFWESRLGRVRTQNFDGSWCDQFYPGAGDPVCGELVNHRTVCKQLVGGLRIETTIITSYRHSVTCMSGSQRWQQLVEERWYGAECPVDGSLVSRSGFTRTASYSIFVNSRTSCPASACDGYAREGDVAPAPGGGLPLDGALGLL